MSKQPVILNVYDLSAKNKYLDSFGLGVYHSGVVVYSSEYCFLGTLSNKSGIFRTLPTELKSIGFDYFKLKLSTIIGYTEYSAEDIRQIVKQMGHEFKGENYNLFYRNCNHFSDAFIQGLCGKRLPDWVNRLALIGSRIPLLERTIPKQFLNQ